MTSTSQWKRVGIALGRHQADCDGSSSPLKERTNKHFPEARGALPTCALSLPDRGNRGTDSRCDLS